MAAILGLHVFLEQVRDLKSVVFYLGAQPRLLRVRVRQTQLVLMHLLGQTLHLAFELFDLRLVGAAVGALVRGGETIFDFLEQGSVGQLSAV